MIMFDYSGEGGGKKLAKFWLRNMWTVPKYTIFKLNWMIIISQEWSCFCFVVNVTLWKTSFFSCDTETVIFVQIEELKKS